MRQIPWSSSKPLSAEVTTTTAAAHPRSCLVQQHLSKPQSQHAQNWLIPVPPLHGVFLPFDHKTYIQRTKQKNLPN